MSNELWCVYIAGPDDLVAMPSKAVAEAVARNFNAVWDRYGAERGHDVRAVAHVEPWMHGKNAHTEDLRKNFWEYAELVLAEQAAEPVEHPRGQVLGYLYVGRPDEDGWQSMEFARVPWDGALRELLDRQGVEEIPVGRVAYAPPKPEHSNYPEFPDSSNPEQAVGYGVFMYLHQSEFDWLTKFPESNANVRALRKSGNNRIPLYATPRPAVTTPAEVTAGSIKRYRVRLVPEESALDGFVAAMVEDMNGDMVLYADHCAAHAAQPSAVGVPDGLADPNNPWRRAVEHAGYLVTRVESYMKARGEESIALEQVEGADEPTDEQLAELEAAAESAHEHWIGMRDGIYEFTKRRDRALATLAAAPEVRP